MKHTILTRRPIGNPHRVWRQDNYVLSTFSAVGGNMRDVLENCKEAGFTMVELNDVVFLLRNSMNRVLGDFTAMWGGSGARLKLKLIDVLEDYANLD